VNQLDALLLILLAPFALLGYSRGFCREIVGLGGLLVGGVAAAAGSTEIAGLLVARDVPAPLAPPVAFAAIFLGVATIANVVGLVLDRILRAMFLGPVNRLAGIAFGIAKGAALAGFALVLAQHVIPAEAFTQVVRASRLASPLMHLATGVLAVGRDMGVPTGDLPRRQAV
jgi:membrane protein required for colicin V production